MPRIVSLNLQLIIHLDCLVKVQWNHFFHAVLDHL
uniref:Uncharacterized protein n=1 Tax=Anguilla anguilla TaxID=7936 RepID=A0A0E9PYK0_ANGAN